MQRVRAIVRNASNTQVPSPTTFLRDTAAFPISAAERLRLFAIALDEDLTCTYEPEQRWATLLPIYDEALRLDPRSTAVWHSRSVSALEAAQAALSGSAIHMRLWRQALHSARNAVDLAPADDAAHYALGQVHYCAEPPQLEDALSCFREARALAADNQWARLYEAHCLQDLQRWTDAAATYQVVRVDAFDGPSGWRRELLLEQRAYCLARAGRRAEALEGFMEVLARREAALERNEDPLTSDTLFLLPDLLVEVAEGILPDLAERTQRLMHRLAQPTR